MGVTTVGEDRNAVSQTRSGKGRVLRAQAATTRQSAWSGFSLIELLVVIAIIALLAAIIFPVFFTVRENARAGTSISNLHDISSKMEQYRLDHSTYPPVLFGYAVPTSLADPTASYVPMDQALAHVQAYDAANTATSSDLTDAYFPGLYPSYINNIATFEDPDDPVSLSAPPVSPPILTTCVGNGASGDDPSCGTKPPGTLVVATRGTQNAFYPADAYDSSPQVTGTNSINKNVSVTRYSLGWTEITTGTTATPPVSGSPPTGLVINPADTETPQQLYTRQLRWKFPPGDTYVTSTTWHVPESNKVLFLTQDGNAVKMDVSQFLQQGSDAQIVDPSTTGVVNTTFWRLNP